MGNHGSQSTDANTDIDAAARAPAAGSAAPRASAADAVRVELDQASRERASSHSSAEAGGYGELAVLPPAAPQAMELSRDPFHAFLRLMRFFG